MIPNLEEVLAGLEAEGHDLDLLLPLYDWLADAAAAAASYHAQDAMLDAAICFGRVTAFFDTMTLLGIPTPTETPVETMMLAEAMLADGGADAVLAQLYPDATE